MRHTWVGAALAVLVAFLLAGLVAQTSPGQGWNILGRTVELDQLSQVTLFLLFMATAALFLVLIFLSLAQVRSRSDFSLWLSSSQQWRVFYPAALLIVGQFGAASLSIHLGLPPFSLNWRHHYGFCHPNRAPGINPCCLRFLILTALSTPLFLLAAWKIDA
jgi:F0F1-type ATP synthase membrane subunit c/vacuolar-type H+-ATPase subunit K